MDDTTQAQWAQQQLEERERLQLRFWSKVEKSDNCWKWIGARHSQGYGWFSVSGLPDKAHRVSWEMHYGPIPAGLSVLHRCDVPECIRPDHLFLGTQIDNIRDMCAKGRQRGKSHPGELNSGARLTNAQVQEMRRLRTETGKPFNVIAKLFNVSTMTAYRAIVGQSWSHL